MLSREASVPGRSWLPCPRVITPDAEQSDFITVRPLPPSSQLRVSSDINCSSLHCLEGQHLMVSIRDVSQC